MYNAFELRAKIDVFLRTLALNRVDRFYPTALAKFLGITPGEAFNNLLDRSGKNDQLTLLWEVRCPDCYRTIDLVQNKISDSYDCNCGEEVESVEENLYPVFKINDDYKTYIRLNEQKKNQKTLPEKSKKSFNYADLNSNPLNIKTLLMETILTEENKETLRDSGLTINVLMKGDLVVGYQNKNEDSFNGSHFNGPTAIQATNTTQIQQGTRVEYSAPLKELEALISRLPDELSREQAESNAEILKSALEKEDKPKIEKYFKFLSGTLGLVSPLITIAQLAGIPIPNLPTV